MHSVSSLSLVFIYIRDLCIKPRVMFAHIYFSNMVPCIIICICRVFAAMTCFVERLYLKQDIFLLMEVSIYGPGSHLSQR